MQTHYRGQRAETKNCLPLLHSSLGTVVEGGCFISLIYECTLQINFISAGTRQAENFADGDDMFSVLPCFIFLQFLTLIREVRGPACCFAARPCCHKYEFDYTLL